MKHTQGTAEITHQSDYQKAIAIGGNAVCFIPKLSPNSEANAILIAEAFNVTNETGKSPAQLAQENKALVELNKGLVEELQNLVTKCLQSDGYRQKIDELYHAQQVLLKAERINK